MGSQEFAAAYKAELKELKVAEKPVINMLTMLAEDNKQHAQAVVGAIESHLRECIPQARLPALYLMDSIIKNVREPYKSLFSKHLDQVFGRVWDSSLVKERERLSKLCKLWEGYLEPNVLARIRARMTTNSTDQKAPAAVPVLQQPRPAQQQQSAPPQRMQPQPVLQPMQVSQQQQVYQQPQQLHPAGMQPMPAHVPPGSNIVLGPGQQLVGGFPVMQPPPQPQSGTVFVVGPQGLLVPVGQSVPQPQPQLIPVQQPMQAIPQHMVGGLPPVSPAHPGWAQQQQQLVPRPMQPPQQQLAGAGHITGHSPAYPGQSPALVHASPHHNSGRSPHHRVGTSPHHTSAPGSSVRSGSHEEQAQAIAASLDTLLQGLTRTGYLNDPALKTTSFDPAFIKKEHKGVIALLKTASDKTRARFKDIQFQRNKRRKAAAASTALHSRTWYLPVNSWITGTTVLQDVEEEQVEEATEDEGPAPPPTVDADPSQTKCAISHEPFDSFYDQDRETWVYRGVVRLQGADAERHGVPDGSIVKVECLAEADLGSSPAALAAAAAAGAAAMAAGEDEADLAAAALAAPAFGQQQQGLAAVPAGDAAAAGAAAGAAAPDDRKPAVLAHVKTEPQEQHADVDMAADVKLDPAAAAAAVVKQQPVDGNGQAAAAAGAAGLKREAADIQQGGTPSKKPRVSPEP